MVCARVRNPIDYRRAPVLTCLQSSGSRKASGLGWSESGAGGVSNGEAAFLGQEAAISKQRVAVRDAEFQDSAVIVDLLRELAAAAGETTPVTEAYVTEYLASAATRALVAEVAGQVAGLLTYSVRPDLYHAASTCLIEELVVRDRMRGRGVGSALLEALLSRVAALGCAEVSVTTLPDNTRAIGFYKTHGLTDQAILLEKHLHR